MTGEFWSASEISRGKVVAVDDSGDSQTLDLTGYRGERFSKVLRAQPHGLSSHPPADAVGLFLRHGSSDRISAIGFETPGRPRNTPAGTAVLYDDKGNTIFAKGTDGLQLRAEQGGFKLSAGDGEVTVAADGTITVKKGALQVLVSATRIDLGGPGGSRVATESGFSDKVFAIL